MTKLVSDDAQRLAVDSGDAGGSDGVAEAALDPGGSEVSAVLDEHEVDWSPVPGVWECSLLLTCGEPVVEGVEGGGVERDDSFGVEFSERHACQLPAGP